MVKRKLTEADILALPAFYKQGLSSWAIAKNFNTTHSNILYHLKKLNFERRDRSFAAKEGVKTGRIRIKKNMIPQNLVLDEDLAYIIGVLCGDGYMSYNLQRHNYNIGLSATDKEFVDKFRQSLYNFFKLNSTEEFKDSRNLNWKPQYITRLCSKAACDYINSIGIFRKENWFVPDSVRCSSEKIKSSFIRGFFDSEGEVDRDSGRIGATSMNLEGLKAVSNLLQEMKMDSTIISIKDNRPNTHQKYRLRIHDKRSILLFANLVNFTIERKARRLNNLIELKNWRG